MRSGVLVQALLFALVVTSKHGEDESEDEPTPSPVSLVGSSTSSLTAAPSSTSNVGSSASATENQSTTLPAASPSPSSAMQFTPPNNLTACAGTAFTWHATVNSDLPLTVAVTNERIVAQGPQQADLVSRTLTTDVAMSAGVVVWPTVDVPEGWYGTIAFDTAGAVGLFAKSQAFFVQVGSDDSCLTSASSSSSAAVPSTTTLFPSSSAGSHRLSSGAFAGIVAGVIAGVGGITAAFVGLRRLRRARRSNIPPRPGGPYLLF